MDVICEELRKIGLREQEVSASAREEGQLSHESTARDSTLASIPKLAEAFLNVSGRLPHRGLSD
jgi:hypothetical protein